MQPVQDLTVEDRVSRTQFQYSIEDADAQELAQWTPKLVAKLQSLPQLRDVATDQLNEGLRTHVTIDRDTASRLGIFPQAIDNTLYDAFGQRQVSTIFTQLNQYHVILEVMPNFAETPENLRDIYIRPSVVTPNTGAPTANGAAVTTNGAPVPLSAFTSMLYESYIHPITILSTIPSAGVGALLALLLTGNELNVIGMIGIILLIGLVKKNAIMMIDVALEVERNQGKKPVEAIYDACILRFRPIMMTTMAALLGGLPLALGSGTGSELHRPLGITIVGGLIVSQMLTLFTTPVVYVYLDRLRLALRGGADRALPDTSARPSPAH